MFDFSKKEFSQEEKIDYIFHTLKAQKRNTRIKYIIIFLFFMYGYYFFILILPSLPEEQKSEFKNKITNFISTQVLEIAKPMIEDISKDMIWQSQWVTSDNITSSKVEELLKKYPHLKEKIK